MTLSLILAVLVLGGGFAYLWYKQGWKVASGAIVALGTSLWAAGGEMVEAVKVFVGFFGG